MAAPSLGEINVTDTRNQLILGSISERRSTWSSMDFTVSGTGSTIVSRPVENKYMDIGSSRTDGGLIQEHGIPLGVSQEELCTQASWSRVA